MNAQTKIEGGTDIVSLVNATPVLVLTDKAKFSEFYDAMKAETDALDADVSTKKGRDAIASMAYKVARTKTAIDDAGKKLNEDARAKISAVDEARRAIRQQLDTLKDQVRAPLTAWEEAEKARQEMAGEEIAGILAAQRVDVEDTSATIQARIDGLDALKLDADVHGEGIETAKQVRGTAIDLLTAALVRVQRAEEERAELDRLRAAEAERAEREAAEKAERERAEAQRHAAERAAQEAAEREQAAKERVARAEREAEERAKAQAEAAARAEREAADRAHADALAAERRRAEAAERAAQEERDRIAREEAARRAEEHRVAAERAAREADREHRSKIMSAVKEAIMQAGPVDEAAAKAIVLALVGGKVPHTSAQF